MIIMLNEYVHILHMYIAEWSWTRSFIVTHNNNINSKKVGPAARGIGQQMLHICTYVSTIGLLQAGWLIGVLVKSQILVEE